jgi:hypothetical protein
MKFRIEGTAIISFARVIEADNIDDAWEEADNLFAEDLEEDDFRWPPIDVTVEDVWDDD